MTSNRPSDLRTEMGMLSCMLDRPKETLAEIGDYTPEQFFYSPINREVFCVMRSLFNDGKPLDMVTVAGRLSDVKRLEAVGGWGFLVEISNFTPLVSNIAYFKAILLDLWLRRECVGHFEAALESAATLEQEKADEWLSGVVGALMATVAAKGGQKKRRSMKELMHRAHDRATASIERNGAIPGASTGFWALDQITGGYQRGQLWVVGGGPSDGKSAFVQNLMLCAATNKVPTAGYTLEMSDDENADRFICIDAAMPSSRLKRGFKNREEMRNFTDSAKKLSDLSPYLHICDVSGIKISALIGDMRLMKATHGIRVFSVDYTQLVSADKKGHSREREVADVSAALKAAAKDMDVTVIAQSQLNDDGKLRESRALGFDCDVGITLSVPQDDKGNRFEDKRTIYIFKNRNGQRHIPLHYGFHGPTFTFKEFKEQDDWKNNDEDEEPKNNHRGAKE